MATTATNYVGFDNTGSELQIYLVKGISSQKKVDTKKQICAGYKIRKTQGSYLHKAEMVNIFGNFCIRMVKL